jgi:hypothetical protein
MQVSNERDVIEEKSQKQAANGFWWSQKRNRSVKLARIFAHIQKT